MTWNEASATTEVVDPGLAHPTPRLPAAFPVAALWLAFGLVHVWLCWAVLHGPHTPLNDVSTVYRQWMENGRAGRGWVGLDLVWVYPTAALVPMNLAATFGFAAYSTTWLGLVVVLDGLALGILTRWGRGRRAPGWWWLSFLLLLGPIAVGRIDTITVPVAIAGLMVLWRAPSVGGGLLAVAAWIKVWPVALLVALLVVIPRRPRLVVTVAATSIGILVLAWIAGGNANAVFGFVGQQTGRGLQLEAPVTTFWLWLEALRVPGVSTTFDQVILTYQVSGPGTNVASALMTPLMALVGVLLVLLGIRAVRSGASIVEVLGPLSLALTTALIVTNKVGSPQYESWLAVPVVLGIVLRRRGGPSFVVPGVIVLLLAALTQVVYPWEYDALVTATPWMLAVITLRNLGLVALLGVAAAAVWRAGTRARMDA